MGVSTIVPRLLVAGMSAGGNVEGVSDVVCIGIQEGLLDGCGAVGSLVVLEGAEVLGSKVGFLLDGCIMEGLLVGVDMGWVVEGATVGLVHESEGHGLG